MPSDWPVHVATCTTGLAAGTVAAIVLLRRGLAALPDGGDARAAAIHALRQRIGAVIGAGGALGAVLGWGVAVIRAGGSDHAASVAVEGTPALLATTVAGIFVAARIGLRLEERVQRPGWSRAVAGRLALWALLSQTLVPVAGALGWLAVHAATREVFLGAAGFAVCAALGSHVVQWSMLRVGRPDEFPHDLREEARRRCGDGPAPDVYLWRCGGAGVWNAWAFARWPHGAVLFSEDLLPELRREETVAVLLHEFGHLRLGHLRVRVRLVLAAVVAAPLAAAAAGIASAYAPFALCWLVLYAGGRAIYARQELEADAFAAERAPAEDLGRALVAMERAKLVPSATQVAISHPALRARLVAMGLDADRLLGAAAPAPPAAAAHAA